MHLANQLMEKMQNPDSDDAGSASSHYFSCLSGTQKQYSAVCYEYIDNQSLQPGRWD